jgi:hypothetical protein
MRIILDGHIQELNTSQVAEYALTLRYHFNGIVGAFEKYGPVRVRGPSAPDNLRVVQMLNRQLVTRSILDRMGIRVHTRGLFVVAVSSRDQLENMALLHTLDNANEKIHVQGSQLRH